MHPVFIQQQCGVLDIINARSCIPNRLSACTHVVRLSCSALSCIALYCNASYCLYSHAPSVHPATGWVSWPPSWQGRQLGTTTAAAPAHTNTDYPSQMAKLVAQTHCRESLLGPGRQRKPHPVAALVHTHVNCCGVHMSIAELWRLPLC